MIGGLDDLGRAIASAKASNSSADIGLPNRYP
jgi:hypothetical protein